MSKYKDRIKELPRVTLDAISEVCRGMLPSEYRSRPWDLPYGDKNFAKIFDQEDQLNGYAAAYTIGIRENCALLLTICRLTLLLVKLP